MPNRNELLDFLNRRYNLDEFQTLCFRLYVNYDDLPAETLNGKQRELLRYMERHDRTADLLRRLERDRPDAYQATFDALPQGEARLDPDQAREIQQMAQAIGRELGRDTGQVLYQPVYARLNRAFHVRSYRDIPAARFAEAKRWLGAWPADSEAQ